VRTLFAPYARPGQALAVERIVGLLRDASRLRTEDFRGPNVAERLGWAAAELGVSVPEAALGEAATRVSEFGSEVPPQPLEFARAVVEDLSRDFALGLVSDTGLTGGSALREVLRSDGLAPPISAFSFSDETGASKPHADAFLTALRELGVRPAEAVHVGDLLPTDVAGACALGMRAVWISEDRAGQPPEGCAVIVVQNLAEVPAAIRAVA
jgi:putative hydrolase of the HAD superfamily